MRMSDSKNIVEIKDGNLRCIMIEIQISVSFLHFKKLKYFLVEFTEFEICSTEQKAFCFFTIIIPFKSAICGGRGY